MNTESHLDWLPASGHQLRKAGVYFDAVRVAGERGRLLADRLAAIVMDGPGPVIEEATGARYVYFLVPSGSTAHRSWPPEASRITGRPGHGDAYIGVPALYGQTWPLAWRYPPTPDGRLVHPLLLHAALRAMTTEPLK